ncbi:hypothetical protein VNI00_006432 [Paramarasmius palmivorus]|uniref:AB hydrolase-1 domain-containing protein n=1 Tax=Paramarasmius palmivorus TaxID=297713 RepID=A0AAW0D8B0_9AGAR
MDASSYKNIKTSRGMTYHYYFSPPRQENGKTLLFIHGFPSTSFDWHHQVAYFEQRGYGLIVPDMLGYGGTSKPTDVAAYRHSLIVNDLKDILDTESIQKVVIIGHDWGVLATARFVAYYPERVQALGFLTVGYLPPSPPGAKFDLDAANRATTKVFGYEVVGYWEFFSAPDAGAVIDANLKTFLDIAFCPDYETAKTDFSPVGALRASLVWGKAYPPAPWLSPKERAHIFTALQDGGLEAPVCYYKVQTSGLQIEDDQQIPPERRDLPNIPIFFGDALKDPVAKEELFLTAFGVGESPLRGENVTRRGFDGGHWLMFEKADEVNRALKDWLEGF